MINPRYKKLRVINYGGFGTVFKCRDILAPPGEDIVAIKEIPYGNDEEVLKTIYYEARMMEMLSHPFIIGYRTCFHLPRSQKAYIVMEYFEGKEIYSICDTPNLSEESTCLELCKIPRLIINIFDALAYIHKKGIAHGDIKLENVLVDTTSWKIKIIDFGSSSHISDGPRENVGHCGTLEYHAPERYDESQILDVPTLIKGDIFAMGVFIYELYGMCIPILTSEKKVKNDLPPIPHKYINKLVKKMLSPLPNDRPSAECILESLKKIFT